MKGWVTHGPHFARTPEPPGRQYSLAPYCSDLELHTPLSLIHDNNRPQWPIHINASCTTCQQRALRRRGPGRAGRGAGRHETRQLNGCWPSLMSDGAGGKARVVTVTGGTAWRIRDEHYNKSYGIHQY